MVELNQSQISNYLNVKKEAIEKDIEDGYVTLQGAKKDYNWTP